MENKSFKYNAFISYRHSDLDKYVAENLHRLIETYKMPKSVVEKYNINDNNFRRIFRDQDELPLSSSLENPIIEALKDSQFLIVICSSRLKESKWCKKEIESFIKLHGRSNILCVLVEGEPDESFPDILKYKEEKVKTKTGKERVKKIPCEPLAMDVRGKNKKEVYQNLKKELIRVIAPMYNLDYDDIKRRHEERELKKKAKIFKTIAIVSILFAIYSIILFSKIYLTSKELKYDQSINLANQANELLNKDDRIGAIKMAYQSITKYENISLPKTAHGVAVLTNCLGLYYYDEHGYYPISQLETSGEVRVIKKDSSWRYLLSYDSSGSITLWNLDGEKKIKVVSDTILHSYNMEDQFAFIGKKHFAYINSDNDVIVINFKGKEIANIKTSIKATQDAKINASSNGKYLEISTGKKISIYETENYKEVASYEVSKDLDIIDNQYFDEKEENIAFATRKTTNYGHNDLNIITYNIAKKRIISKYNIKSNALLRIIFKDDSVVALTKRIVSNYRYGSDMLLTRYNYKTGKKTYQREYLGYYGDDMELAYAKNGETALLVVSGYTASLVNYKTGEEKARYDLSNTATLIQPINGGEGYFQVITSLGEVINISIKDGKYDDSAQLVGMYHFNLPGYSKFLYTDFGYVAFSNHSSSGNTNRIITYHRLKNKDMKEIEYKEDTYNYNRMENNNLDSQEIKTIDKDYNFKDKDLISAAFYSHDKSLLFISYKYKTMEIYDNKNKKLIKTIRNIKDIQNVYIGKTKEGQYIIRGNSNGYILNKDFDLIAYVSNLVDYKDNKLIIKDWDKYYAVKVYTEKEIIEKGKEFLESKKLID